MTTHKDLIAPILQGLRDAFHTQKLLPISARKNALKQLLRAVSENEPRIIQALHHDLGRGPFESYVAEIAFVKEEIKLALKSLKGWSQQRLVATPLVFQPGQSYIEPTPKGVVLIVAPWNYPFQLSLVPLISAIAAGNCVVLKPSELAVMSQDVIKDLVHDYLDQSCFRVLIGDGDLAKDLVEAPFDHIFYTGSTRVGREVMRAAAENLTPVTLELGGKSPVIIDGDTNLELAAKRIMWAKCLNAGQTCIAPDYVLIKRELLKPFIASAQKHLLDMYGPAAEQSPHYGRIINERHAERLVAYLKDGSIAHGGGYDVAEKYIEPTILTDIKDKAPVMKDEIFGPILPVIGVDTMDEAVRMVNARQYPLALYIFSNNKKTIRKICDQTLSGGVAINDCISHVAIPSLPFGGVRHSGMGAYHGAFGFETFSHMRAVHKRANMLDNPIKYPPYSDMKLNLARMVM
jgi:aldehyde dehydrogenase (NAD+)